MKSRRSSSKSGLFLLELIIAIVFFAAASAACTQLFVQAHLTSNHSRDLNMAANIAQNTAESFQSGSGEVAVAQYYNSQGRAVSAGEEAAYRLEVAGDMPSPGLYAADIAVYKAGGEGGPLFTLRVQKYRP